MQEQFGRTNHRLRMESLAHHPLEQGVGDRDDRHSLVVRHERADDRDLLSVQQPARREVERLEKSEAAARAESRQAREIACRGDRVDHRGERGRVGRDDGVLAQSALQPEPRNAEVGILVGELQVARIVGGFGDAPGRAKRPGIVDLASNDRAIGLPEDAFGRRAHDQRRA